ncbi:MAG: biotin--[acetyl-CoA-carboxylase] ligase [Pirellulaceae bacterium]
MFDSRQPIIDQLRASGWIHAVHWFDSIDSTNSVARRELMKTGVSPVLFIADQQTAGRGRSDHHWWSPNGCLMLTLTIDSACLPDNRNDWGQLALVCGVAAADSVDHILGSSVAQLKWPNDIYLDGKKLGGILIESVRTQSPPMDLSETTPLLQRGYRPDNYQWLIGIGVNVDVDWENAPRDLRHTANCLTQYAGTHIDASALLVDLLQRLELRIIDWAQNSGQNWSDDWKRRCLLTGKLVRAQVNDRPDPMVGYCPGIDSRGRLLLESATGLQTLVSAQILDWHEPGAH